MRVTAVIVKNEKVLLMHRKRDGVEYWIFPGGSIEKSENEEDALKREVAEETTLKVKFWKKELTFDDENDKNHPVFYCEVEDGKARLAADSPEALENSEANWYNPEWIDIKEALTYENLYPVAGKEILKKQLL